MKIGELARRAGVSRETIHFYLREGLLPRPQKAGRTVSFYNDEHLQRLLLVRRLREENFLPLSVIRRLLEKGRVRADRQDIELLSEISRMSPLDEGEDLPPGEVASEVGIPVALLDRARRASLIDPVGRLGPGDRRVLQAIAEIGRLDVESGAVQLTIDDMRVCREHLDRMVEEEARLFFARLLAGNPAEAVAALRAGRGPVAHFVAAYRARCLHALVDRTLAEIDEGIAAAARSATRPLSERALKLADYHRTLRVLSECARSPTGRPEDWVTLLRFLFGVGDHAAVNALSRTLGPDLEGDPRVLAYSGAARCELKDLEGGLTLLARARQLAPEWGLARALHGAMVLRTLAARNQTPPSRSVMVDGARAIADLDTSIADPHAAAPDLRFCQYLQARVSALLPPIFGRHETAKAELERLAAEPLSATDLEALRLRGNARLALGLPSEDVVH